MVKFERLIPTPHSLYVATAIQFDCFEEIVRLLDRALAAKRLSLRLKRKRKRGPGAGRPHRHDLRTRTLTALVFLISQPTYELLGRLFGLDRTTAFRQIRMVAPMIRAIVQEQRVKAYGQMRQSFEDLGKRFQVDSTVTKTRRSNGRVGTLAALSEAWPAFAREFRGAQKLRR